MEASAGAPRGVPATTFSPVRSVLFSGGDKVAMGDPDNLLE
jgi:hypothetical protein